MHTLIRHRFAFRRKALGLAVAVIAFAAGPLALGATVANAATMPDWAADFDSAGDAFEGGGGGGGGSWWPSPLHPGTASGGGSDVPTTCTSRPTAGGEELECSPSYPATSLPPARSTPDYGVTTGSGGKGLGDRDGGWVDPVRDLEGERMVAEWDRLLGKWDALDKRGADLNEAEKAEKARLFDEINRIEAKLKARGWTYQDDPAKPDFGTWYPPFLCC